MFRSNILLAAVLILPAFAQEVDPIWRNFLSQERPEMCAMNRPLAYSSMSIEVCDLYKKVRFNRREQRQEERTESGPELFWKFERI